MLSIIWLLLSCIEMLIVCLCLLHDLLRRRLTLPNRQSKLKLAVTFPLPLLPRYIAKGCVLSGADCVYGCLEVIFREQRRKIFYEHSAALRDRLAHASSFLTSSKWLHLAIGQYLKFQDSQNAFEAHPYRSPLATSNRQASTSTLCSEGSASFFVRVSREVRMSVPSKISSSFRGSGKFGFVWEVSPMPTLYEAHRRSTSKGHLGLLKMTPR